MTYALDTTESAAEEQAGMLLIREAMQRIEVILSLPTWVDPEPGSPIYAVDKLTPYQPMSNHLKSFNAVAVDNLRATARYLEKANDVPMIALYSMIRSAVESTSYGL